MKFSVECKESPETILLLEANMERRSRGSQAPIQGASETRPLLADSGRSPDDVM